MIIKHLPLQEAQKIAAGEVVERPANIIKELIENALDAGATKITLAVTDGGKSSITITDNGNGMDKDDAHICFLRHTTSKLTTFDELETITTFGFRGEALASMCSVAQVIIATRHVGSDHGVKLSIENNTIIQEEIIGIPAGTTITINNLFYNIPVRKKFLKTTATEWNQIVQLFKAFCLSHLNVHFSLSHNGTNVYVCPSTELLQERVAHIFEATISKQLIPFSATDTTSACSGVMTGTHYSRYDRSGIFTFVNKRWVKNYELSQAVIKGYLNVLPSGKYPLAIVHITTNTEEVDINTHPKKEIVVFLHPKRIEHLITDAIKKSLESSTTDRIEQTKYKEFPSSFVQTGASFNPYRPIFKDMPPVFSRIPVRETSTSDITTQNTIESLPERLIENFATPYTQENYIETLWDSYTIFGQLHLTYILLEHPDGLLLIDQHAAHERIIYERIITTFTQPETIALLFPETISLSSDAVTTIIDYLPILHAHGIIIEQLSPTNFIIRSKPVYTQAIPLDQLLLQMLGWINESGKADNDQIRKNITEKMRAQIACKAAIKAGDTLTQEKMSSLLNDLNKTTNRFTCPHGRPTSWLLPLLDIEKKFKRKL